MITDIEVEDYQALRKLSLRPGRFTVITGPTSSGKSALVRALKLVAFNAQGTGFVRRGAKSCKVAVGFHGESLVIGIERGGRGKDAYRVVRPGDPDGPPQVTTLTKLAGRTPDEVSSLLRLGEINFAGQLDMPYLLTESGSQVARVLGELTNVTLVLDAAREANRRKLETGRELRHAADRLADLKEQAKGFGSLKARLAAAREAREWLASVDAASQRLGSLSGLLVRYATALAERMQAEAQLAEATLPSPNRMIELQQRAARLLALAGEHADACTDRENAADEAENWKRVQAEAGDAVHRLLEEAGTCPTCGQAVTGA